MFPAPEYEPPVRPESTVFLPDHPMKMLKEGNFNYVPYIQGVVEDEGAYQGGRMCSKYNVNSYEIVESLLEDTSFLSTVTVNDEEYTEDVNYRWINIGANAVGLETRNISKLNMHKGLRKLRRFYFGDEDIQPKHLQNLTDLYSDAWFISGLHQTIKYHSMHAPIYPYIFVKKGAIGLANLLGHFDRPGECLDQLYTAAASFPKS